MAENLKKRVISQRGASLSMALFVFLVCAMASAAVLAASSAAAGHYIELGKFDQRYYSVISAADLFRGTATDKEVTYTVVETRTNTGDERTSDDPDETSILFTSITREPNETLTFDFLQDVTLYALYGPNGVPNNKVVGTSWDTVKPFDAGDESVANWWTPNSFTGYCENTYTIEPQMSGGDKLTVTVTVRVHDNWLVEVVASSGDDNRDDDTPAEKRERFDYYMAFQGTCNQGDPSISSTLGETVVSGGTVTNVVDVEETRTTTVTWKLVRLMPGRGFMRDD